jgi:hypothetical protein
MPIRKSGLGPTAIPFRVAPSEIDQSNLVEHPVSQNPAPQPEHANVRPAALPADPILS